MANRMPMQPGDGGNPNGAQQQYYYSQNGTPPQQMYLNYPVAYAQLQAMNAQQQQQQLYQNFVESQRRAQASMGNRNQQQQQQLQGHPQQMQQQQQQQQQQRLAGMQGYPGGHPSNGMDADTSYDQKSQAEKTEMLELLRTQGAAGKMFPQRGGMPPQQQQQQQQRVPGMPAYPSGTFDREDGYDGANGQQGDKDVMAELLRNQGNQNKSLQQQLRSLQQQQQQRAGMPGYPAGHPSSGMDGQPAGDGLEPKTQAEKKALLDLLRTQTGPSEPNNNNSQGLRGPQQQQQQQRPGGVLLPASAVGPHLDPAIATAIPTGSPPAATGAAMQLGGMPAMTAAGVTSTPPTMGGNVNASNNNNNNTTGAGMGSRGKIEVDDEYGLKPLVKVLTAAPVMSNTPHVPTPDEPTDPTTGRPISQQEADEINFSFITRGFDITQLGLSVSQQEWLHPTLATLPLDTHNYFILPEFKIPDSYKKPRPRSLSMKSFHQFKEETLFYIFYSMPRDVLHLAAARALYERGWRYHKREQHWFHPVKLEDGTLMEKVTTAPDGQKVFTGVYNVFHPNEWKQVRTPDNYTVLSSEVEEQSVLVAAMEEAARQQSQRSKAKAAQTAAGGGNGNASNGPSSPANATPAASA